MTRKSIYTVLLIVSLITTAFAYTNWFYMDFAAYSSDERTDSYSTLKRYQLKGDDEWWPEGVDLKCVLYRVSDNYEIFAVHITSEDDFYNFTVPNGGNYRLHIEEQGGQPGRLRVKYEII